jgi:hypothetical protein
MCQDYIFYEKVHADFSFRWRNEAMRAKLSDVFLRDTLKLLLKAAGVTSSSSSSLASASLSFAGVGASESSQAESPLWNRPQSVTAREITAFPHTGAVGTESQVSSRSKIPNKLGTVRTFLRPGETAELWTAGVQLYHRQHSLNHRHQPFRERPVQKSLESRVSNLKGNKLERRQRSLACSRAYQQENAQRFSYVVTVFLEIVRDDRLFCFVVLSHISLIRYHKNMEL